MSKILNHSATFADGNGQVYQVDMVLRLDDMARKLANRARLNGRLRASMLDGSASITVRKA